MSNSTESAGEGKQFLEFFSLTVFFLQLKPEEAILYLHKHLNMLIVHMSYQRDRDNLACWPGGLVSVLEMQTRYQIPFL